jgi:hypothetical protein
MDGTLGDILTIEDFKGAINDRSWGTWVKKAGSGEYP